MAITHGPAIRDVVCNNVVDAIDVGGAGKLIFQTAASVAAATLTMSGYSLWRCGLRLGYS